MSGEQIGERRLPTQRDIETIFREMDPSLLPDSEYVLSVLDREVPPIDMIAFSSPPELPIHRAPEDYVGVGFPVRCESTEPGKFKVLAIDIVNSLFAAGKDQAAITLDLTFWDRAEAIMRPNRRRPNSDYIRRNYRTLTNTTFVTFEQ